MEKLQLDIGELTLGEMELWEELTGEPFGSFLSACDGDLQRLPTRHLLALIVVLKRRDDPDYSLDDARQLHISDVEFAADPTAAAGTSASGRRSRTTST